MKRNLFVITLVISFSLHSQFKREWSTGEYNISFAGCAFQSNGIIAHSDALNLILSAGEVTLKKVNSETLLIEDSINLNNELGFSYINCSGVFNVNDSIIVAVVNSLQTYSSWVCLLNEDLEIIKTIDISSFGSFTAGSNIIKGDTLIFGGGVLNQNSRLPAIAKINIKGNYKLIKTFTDHPDGFLTSIKEVKNEYYCGMAFSDSDKDFMRLNNSFDTLFTKDIRAEFNGEHYPIEFFEKADTLFSIVKYPWGIIISQIDSAFNVYTKDTVSVIEHNISSYSLDVQNLDSIFYVPFASEDYLISQIQGKTNPLSTLCFNYKGHLHYQHDFDSTQYYKGIGVVPTPTGPISVGYRYTGETHPDSVKTKLVLLKLDRTGSLVNLSEGEIKLEDNIGIYPNPAKDRIAISGLKGTGEVNIFNMEGKSLITQSFNHGEYQLPKSIDISKLQNGVYILQVNSGSKFSGRVKFIIAK